MTRPSIVRATPAVARKQADWIVGIVGILRCVKLYYGLSNKHALSESESSQANKRGAGGTLTASTTMLGQERSVSSEGVAPRRNIQDATFENLSASGEGRRAELQRRRGVLLSDYHGAGQKPHVYQS